jgi:hypothetical protein
MYCHHFATSDAKAFRISDFKTAKILGVVIPAPTLLRADEVIE